MTGCSLSFLNKWRVPDDEGTAAAPTSAPWGHKGAFYIFEGSPGDLGMKAFGSYYLLFNQFIPFELMIIIEMVKVHYTIFMEADVELIHVAPDDNTLQRKLSMREQRALVKQDKEEKKPKSGGKEGQGDVEITTRFRAQNLSMHEEIGQVQYLFCDKTGTLTKNELLFREMAVLPDDATQQNMAPKSSTPN